MGMRDFTRTFRQASPGRVSLAVTMKMLPSAIVPRKPSLVAWPVGDWKQAKASASPRAQGKPFLAAGRVLVTFLLPCISMCPAAGQTTAVPHSLADDLRQFVETPSVSGYESELAEKIQAKLAPLHPVTDNLGDVIVTFGRGAPRRLIVTPIDEPGFVVSHVTEDGYLRLERLPQSGLPPIFNKLYSAQPVRVGTGSGRWVDGVMAGLSVHLQAGRANAPESGDIENMYVDIGASSAEEVRKNSVDLLSPVVINRRLFNLNDDRVAGASIGDKFGAAALADLVREIDPAKVQGSLTVAFFVQGRTDARGLERILSTNSFDEMVYVGRLLPGGAIPGIEGVHRAPRREPGGGVLFGLARTNDTFSGLTADLKQLADSHKIPVAVDYSADVMARSAPAFPARWAHAAIAVSWPDTPGETLALADLANLTRLLKIYAVGSSADGDTGPASIERARSTEHRPPSLGEVLEQLVAAYGASGHEQDVAASIKLLLPAWAKPETDDAGNLILHLGTAQSGPKTPRILLIAHMDEIGFEVKSISKDGRLEAELLGGMERSYYQGHPMLVHTSRGDRDAVMELPNGWDAPNFKWPAESAETIRVDVGARNPDDVAKLGIQVGDFITIQKQYRPLVGTRANGRSFDDRVGDAALISAVWALGGPVQGRDVTFVWSTREEVGLMGAGALAKRLAAAGRTPDYVFAVDTIVSSDSPLESKRFADVQLGKGFAIRAIDNSNIDPRRLVDRLAELARSNQIPFQIGITGGGNDGAMFVPYGAVDVAIGWPLRYSHSPGEVIDTRDVDALARIVKVIAQSW